MSTNDKSNDCGAEETVVSNKPDIPLNDREKELFLIAMAYCLKSGPVKIDYDLFEKYGDFKTTKTAMNTWSKIKGKLPEMKAADDAAKPKTPKKATPAKKRATPAKKAAEDGEESEEEEKSPTKKVKKTPAKKSKVKVDPELEAEAGDE